jgi:DNA-binding transcriptional LysR family regulator
MTQLSLDWNLLVALDVLLAERSVTAAAARLHLSVPATSRTLGRIRQTFNDPMLVRAGRGLTPTPRALALQGRLHQLIEEAQALVGTGATLDLTTLETTFTIRANDAIIAVLATELVGRLQEATPGVRLHFAPEGQEDIDPLRNGQIDLDLGSIPDVGPEIRIQRLYEETLVGVVAPGHPLASGRVTLRRLASADHVAVSRRGRARGPLDRLLDEHGLTRRVAAVVPTFTSAAHMILRSELVGLLPARYARSISAISRAHVFTIPADLPMLVISQAWHVRHDADLAHTWLRGQVLRSIEDDGRRSP